MQCRKTLRLRMPGGSGDEKAFSRLRSVPFLVLLRQTRLQTIEFNNPNTILYICDPLSTTTTDGDFQSTAGTANLGATHFGTSDGMGLGPSGQTIELYRGRIVGSNCGHAGGSTGTVDWQTGQTYSRGARHNQGFHSSGEERSRLAHCGRSNTQCPVRETDGRPGPGPITSTTSYGSHESFSFSVVASGGHSSRLCWSVGLLILCVDKGRSTQPLITVRVSVLYAPSLYKSYHLCSHTSPR